MISYRLLDSDETKCFIFASTESETKLINAFKNDRIAPGAKRRGKFPLVGRFYSPGDLKTLRYREKFYLLSRSKAQRQCDYLLYTSVFESQKKIRWRSRTRSFQSSLIFGVCMFVTQKVLEHLSRAPQYYLPPDSNIYFHYRAATKAETKEPFEKPLEASRMF